MIDIETAKQQILESFGKDWPAGFTIEADTVTDNILITNGKPGSLGLGFAITRTAIADGRFIEEAPASVSRLLKLTKALHMARDAEWSVSNPHGFVTP